MYYIGKKSNLVQSLMKYPKKIQIHLHYDLCVFIMNTTHTVNSSNCSINFNVFEIDEKMVEISDLWYHGSAIYCLLELFEKNLGQNWFVKIYKKNQKSLKWIEYNQVKMVKGRSLP